MVVQNLSDFFIRLHSQNFAQWEDRFGKYDVNFSDESIEFCAQSYDYEILFKTKLSKVFFFKTSNYILSIGGFEAHNRGKIEANKRNSSLITVPTQLANDSFGTNRYSLQENEFKASIGGIFPRKTIFDLSILLSNEMEKSLWGVGEYIGLYFSIIDYALKHEENFDELIIWTVKQIDELYSLLETRNRKAILKRIANLLTIKCLIMRANENHEIGCGIDHSFARYFEKNSLIPHGKAVYLGSLLTQCLYPEWEAWGIPLYKLINIGYYMNITTADIQYLKTLDLSDLINEASSLRPKRSFSLDKIQEKEMMRIKKAKEQINIIQEIWAK